MATFEETFKQFTKMKQKRAVLRHIVEHLDSNFRSAADQPPKKVLLTEDKIEVTQEVFEEMAQELNQEEAQINDQLDSIMKSSISTQK